MSAVRHKRKLSDQSGMTEVSNTERKTNGGNTLRLLQVRHAEKLRHVGLFDLQGQRRLFRSNEWPGIEPVVAKTDTSENNGDDDPDQETYLPIGMAPGQIFHCREDCKMKRKRTLFKSEFKNNSIFYNVVVYLKYNANRLDIDQLLSPVIDEYVDALYKTNKQVLHSAIHTAISKLRVRNSYLSLVSIQRTVLLNALAWMLVDEDVFTSIDTHVLSKLVYCDRGTIESKGSILLRTHKYSSIDNYLGHRRSTLLPSSIILSDAQIVDIFLALQPELYHTTLHAQYVVPTLIKKMFTKARIEGCHYKTIKNSTAIPYDVFVSVVSSSEPWIYTFLDDVVTSGHVFLYTLNDIVYITLSAYREAAQLIARYSQASSVVASPTTQRVTFDGTDLDTDQKLACLTALTSPFSIIHGGAGSGKTECVQRILGALSHTHNVILCAPTGKAAHILKEKTKVEHTFTCDRLIYYLMFYSPITPEEEKLWDVSPYKVALNSFFRESTDICIVIDEAGLLDTMKLASMLYLSGRHAQVKKVILCGDTNQLQPMEPGVPFLSCLEHAHWSQHVELKQNHRIVGTGGFTIAENSKYIRNGETRIITGSDYSIIDSNENSILAQQYIQLYHRVDPTQIVCVVGQNARVIEINTLIREAVNPPSYDKKETEVRTINIRPSNGPKCKWVFRQGDRIMNTVNNRVNPDLINGSVGTIDSIVQSQDAREGKVLRVTLDTGATALVPVADQSDWVPAYVRTAHKTQGDEYDIVLVHLNAQNLGFLDRRYLYTCVTRAKSKVIVYGGARLYRQFVQKLHPSPTTILSHIISGNMRRY